MTREEAIAFLQGRIDLIDKYYPQIEDYREALDMAIKALKQEPCDDAIIRHVVKEQMIKYGFNAPDMTVTEFVENLPPVTPQTRWIPVSERLPEERDWYLAVFKESDTEFQLIPRVADYIGMGENNWQLMDEDSLPLEYRKLLECIAWMPLPEPYKTESENKE